jgi:hypothetical protein
MTGCEHETAEHLATARLTAATWCLCVLTALLCLVTILLAEATWADKQHHEPVATRETTQR